VDGPSAMKPICFLLVLAHTFSCFRLDVQCTEAVADQLQTESYSHHSDYKNIWSYRNNINVSEACNQTVPDDGIIEVRPDDGILNKGCQIYKWFIHDDDIDGYDVTINSLQLNENVSNYLIISPGPSLVPDEASVVITGTILKPSTFRVIDYNNMTILLVIQNTGDTSTNSFRLSYKAYVLTTAMPDITTPSTPEPPDATVYVSTINNGKFNETGLKAAVAEMANNFCNNTGIPYLEITQPTNVTLSTSRCPTAWNNSENCYQIVMTVPVSVPEGHKYELSRSNLEDMWKTLAPAELPLLNLEEHQGPSNRENTRSEGLDPWLTWLWITLGVAVVFTILLVGLWHFDVFNTSNKKDPQVSPDTRGSKASKASWVSESSSYQEVPPNFPQDNDYTKSSENRETATSTNTLPFSHERPSSNQFAAAFHMQRTGYDNRSFDHSSEQHHRPNTLYRDDFSSDDDSSPRTSSDTQSHFDHLHPGYTRSKNESAL